LHFRASEIQATKNTIDIMHWITAVSVNVVIHFE